MLRNFAITWLTMMTATVAVAAPTAADPATTAVAYVKQDPLAQNAQTKSVEVYDHGIKVLGIPGISAAISMDETVCRPIVKGGELEIIGVSRGDAVVIYWTGVEQVNLAVKVVAAPVRLPPPSLARGPQFGSSGFIRTFTTANLSSSSKSMLLDNQFAWTTQLDPHRKLLVEGVTEDAVRRFGRGFNFTSLAVTLQAGSYEARLGDFAVLLRPDGVGNLSMQFPTPVLALRGADVLFKRGKNAYEVFAGTGVPSFFLSYGGVARAAGVNYKRDLSNKMSLLVNGLFSTALRDPFSAARAPRQKDLTLLPIISYRWNSHWSGEGGLGFSTHGLRLTSEVGYRGGRTSLFGAFSRMDDHFPFQLLRTGATLGQNLAFGGSYRMSTKLTINGNFQRHFASFDNTQNIHFGAANNFGISAQYAVSSREIVSGGYSLSGEGTGNNVKLTLHDLNVGITSQLRAASNTLEFSTLRSDSSQHDMASHHDFTLMDGMRYGLHHGIQLTGGFSYTHTSFPLQARIAENLGLLSPALQQLFLANPAAFLNTNLLPPDVRAAIDRVQPSGLQFNAGADFSHGRWSASPQASFGVQRLTGSNMHNVQFGYRVSYELTPTLWLDSSLSSQYYATATGVQRTNLISFGLQKSLNSNPAQWLSSRFVRREISGRVFLDHRGDGTFHQGETSLAGIQLRLNDGTTVVTDEQGEFVFRGLAARSYRVVLPIDQFPTPVRLTGSSEMEADLTRDKSVELDFGVVNYARILGTVYNDYLMDGERQADAPPMSGIRLNVTRDQGTRQVVTTDAGGGFDVSDLEPGHYSLSVDADSLPAGYYIPASAAKSLDVAPVSSVTAEIPLRAMRSISGKVLLRENAADPMSPTRPLAGVMVTADHTIVKTAADGTFMLRDLPAGELTLRVLPNSAAPSSVQLPQGQIRMPYEPKQIENVTIIINDPTLLNYLLPNRQTVASNLISR